MPAFCVTLVYAIVCVVPRVHLSPGVCVPVLIAPCLCVFTHPGVCSSTCLWFANLSQVSV